jgi:hypothetical protein
LSQLSSGAPGAILQTRRDEHREAARFPRRIQIHRAAYIELGDEEYTDEG